MTLLNRNLHRLAIMLGATLSLASCGGGGGGDTAAAPTATITDVTPRGMVASASARTIIISGTNLASGMTITATDIDNTNYAGTTTYNSSPGNLSVPVTIVTAPDVRYLTLSLKSSTGTILATEILGVASVNRTIAADIQTQIFDAYCMSCHGSGGGLDLRSNSLPSGNTAAVDGLIDKTSSGCSQKLRVKAGDPRRSNNVLLDVLQINPVLSCNLPTQRHMPQSAARLSNTDIGIITDWIAGGAH